MTLPSEAEFTRLTEEQFQRIRQQRQEDIAEGEAVAQREFGEGTLGREDVARTEDVADVIARRKALADQAANTQAQKEASQRALDIQSQKNLRQIKGELGSQGVRGGINIESQLESLGGREQAEALLTTNLAQQQFAQQQASLSGLETSVLSAEEGEAQRRLTNERRALQERLGRTVLPLQFAQLGATERATAAADVRSAAQTRLQAGQAQEELEIARLQAGQPAQPATVVQQSGGKIICGELYRQGLLEEVIYRGDLEYAKGVDLETKIGYITLATPLVELMRVSPFVTAVTRVIATGWATEMAYRAGYVNQGSFIGKALTVTAEPFCKLIGTYLKALKVA